MRKVFFNIDHNIEFHEKGYVVVPFFNTDEISQALDIFEKHVVKSDKPFYLSIWNNDVQSRMDVHNRIQPIVEHCAKDILISYKSLISCFAVKMNSSDSMWSLHQDDSFTDESRFNSLSIWVALTDVDASNGAMRVLEGSHMIYTGPRSPTIPKSFAPDDESLHKRMKTLKMKAGEAVFFDHRLLHDSGVNNGRQVRIASVSVLIPNEAPVWFYYNQNGLVQTIRLNEDYYLKFKLGERPDGIVVEVNPLKSVLAKELKFPNL